ncbi:MAG: response regulator transcription factor [Alphaproteobacteria bacterium]|nr:response regulator transcription factor [Alphaproteobacteria bacterium]
MVKISIISDNNELKDDLANQLSRFVSGAEIVTDSPDVIVYDGKMLSAQSVRADYASVPIIYLVDDGDDIGDELNICLKKPLRLMRLFDVVRSANNKLDGSEAGCLTFNDYRLYPNKREIIDLISGNVFKLTEKEVGIIKYLYRKAPEFVSKNDLQINVWQYNEDVTTHTIETHIYRLRQKVEQDNGRRLIITDKGGYKLKTDKDA